MEAIIGIFALIGSSAAWFVSMLMIGPNDEWESPTRKQEILSFVATLSAIALDIWIIVWVFKQVF